MNHIDVDGPQGEVTLLLGQSRIYGRKSIAGEQAFRSIAEQVKGCRKFSDRRQIPLREEDILEEAPGLGGHLYWEGGGSKWDTEGKQPKTRPMLTQLVKDVLAGRVKLIIVWDFSRLWRHSGLCSDLIELFALKGVLLADRNGFCDISTPEGRKRMVQNAAMYQEYREMISVNTRRSFEDKRERGEAVAIGRCIGYQRVAKRTVEHIPEEICLVRRIYTMFVLGERGGPPMSQGQISERLMEEGLTKLFPTARYEPAQRAEERHVHFATLTRMMSSPRHIGKQRVVDNAATAELRRANPQAEEITWLCDANEFLIDGHPAVDPTIWQAAQAKLIRRKHVPRRQAAGRAGSGLLRCGECSKTFILTKGPKRLTKDGEEVRALSAWTARTCPSYHRCSHVRLSITHEAWLMFFRTEFANVLKAEVRKVHALSTMADMESRIAELRIQRNRLTSFLDKCVEDSIDNIVAGRRTISADGVERAKDRVHEIDAKLLELMDAAEQQERSISSFDAFENGDDESIRETLRSAIVWAAVVPVNNGLEQPSTAKKSRSVVVGHVLFLTSWRTYHTAAIERRVVAGRTNRRRSTNVLRLLPAEEGLGTIMNLPDPERFYKNLVREQGYRRTRGAFRPENWAPGFGQAVDNIDSIEDLLSIDLE